MSNFPFVLGLFEVRHFVVVPRVVGRMAEPELPVLVLASYHIEACPFSVCSATPCYLLFTSPEHRVPFLGWVLFGKWRRKPVKLAVNWVETRQGTHRVWASLKAHWSHNPSLVSQSWAS